MTFNQNPFVVVVWSDSIGAGDQQHQWPALVETFCNVALNTGRIVKVLNESAGGMPAARARHEFESRVLRHSPDLVVIQFGFNDLRHDGSRGAQPISTPEEFGEHVTDMILKCRERTGSRVVIFGNHRARSALVMPGGLTYDETRARYNAAARQAAEAAGVPFYDMAVELKAPEADWKDFVCADGVHLSPLGCHAYAWFAASLVSRLMAAPKA